MKSARSLITIQLPSPTHRHTRSYGEQTTATPTNEDEHFLSFTNQFSKKIQEKVQPPIINENKLDASFDSQSDEEDYMEEEKAPAFNLKAQQNWTNFIDCYFKTSSKRCSLRAVYDIYLEKIRDSQEYLNSIAYKKKTGSNPMLVTKEDLKKITDAENNIQGRKVSNFWNNVDPSRRPLKKKTIPQTEMVKSKAKNPRLLNTMAQKKESGQSVSVSSFSSGKHVVSDKTPLNTTKKLVPNAPYKKSMLFVEECEIQV